MALNRVWRNGPARNLGHSPGFNEVRNFFDFRSVKIGAWVKDAEQKQRAEEFFIALLDLQEILALPNFAISLRGTLSRHYGTGGQFGVCAHYQPSARVLALAKHAGIAVLLMSGPTHWITTFQVPALKRIQELGLLPPLG